MVVGLGIDLVEISRVSRLLLAWGDRFLVRILRAEEVGRLPPPGDGRDEAVAFAVAAKEAASKALGTGWSRGVYWRDVEVDLAARAVLLHGGAGVAARGRGSDGRCRLHLERRGELALGELWLLSAEAPSPGP